MNPGRDPRDRDLRDGGGRCPDWYHADNDFPTRARMDWAHSPIVALAARTLGSDAATVLDLGCGNGALLRKVLGLRPRAVPIGIERDAARVEHARGLLPDHRDGLIVGDVLADEPYASLPARIDLALLNPRRILESPASAGAALRHRLRARCARLLVYAYGKGRTEHGDLGGFAAAAGITVAPHDATARAALAVRW